MRTALPVIPESTTVPSTEDDNSLSAKVSVICSSVAVTTLPEDPSKLVVSRWSSCRVSSASMTSCDWLTGSEEAGSEVTV